MPAVSDLQGLWSTGGCGFDVALAAITRDDVDLWLLLEPGDDGLWIAARQQVHDAMPFQVDDYRAVAVSTPPGPIINPHDPRRCMRRQGTRTDDIEQRVRTQSESQHQQEAVSSFAPEGKGNRLNHVSQPVESPDGNIDQRGQSFREDRPRAGEIVAQYQRRVCSWMRTPIPCQGRSASVR